MKHVKLFEQFISEAVDVEGLVKHLESELEWNGGKAKHVTDESDIKWMFDKGPKDKKNHFISYYGMKGSSIAKDIRDAVKGFGCKAVQVNREVMDNDHAYHIEIKS